MEDSIACVLFLSPARLGANRDTVSLVCAEVCTL